MPIHRGRFPYYTKIMRRTVPRWVVLTTLMLGLALAYAGLVGLRVLYPMRYAGILIECAEKYKLEPAFVASVIRAESRFKPNAVSPKGAIGLMQIMPATGAWIAEQIGDDSFATEDLYDPQLNVEFGTWYLASLLARFSEAHVALQAYNAGPSNAERWLIGEGEPFPETAAYVDRVMASTPVYRFYLRFPSVLRITPSLRL